MCPSRAAACRTEKERVRIQPDSLCCERGRLTRRRPAAAAAKQSTQLGTSHLTK